MPRETDGATASANKEVRKAQEQTQRRKRGSYHHYDDETRAKIAKYSCDNGNKAAASKFSAELGHVVTESTVRNMKKAYLSLLKLLTYVTRCSCTTHQNAKLNRR